jgi:hypothetical protein
MSELVYHLILLPQHQKPLKTDKCIAPYLNMFPMLAAI